jgi:hypothetical protein
VIEQPQQRFVTIEAAEKLTALFDLRLDPKHPDWEILCTYGDRTEEFLTHYENSTSLTEDDKFALMAMIVCSFEDWLARNGDEQPLAGRLRKQLAADFAIHEATVYYWCRWETAPEPDPDPDHLWAISPLMRDIWRQARSSPGAAG